MCVCFVFRVNAGILKSSTKEEHGQGISVWAQMPPYTVAHWQDSAF